MKSEFYELATEENLQQQIMVNPFADVKQQVSNQSFRQFKQEKLWWRIVVQFHINHSQDNYAAHITMAVCDKLTEKFS